VSIQKRVSAQRIECDQPHFSGRHSGRDAGHEHLVEGALRIIRQRARIASILPRNRLGIDDPGRNRPGAESGFTSSIQRESSSVRCHE
jgi:hypothetical protein